MKTKTFGALICQRQGYALQVMSTRWGISTHFSQQNVEFLTNIFWSPFSRRHKVSLSVWWNFNGWFFVPKGAPSCKWQWLLTSLLLHDMHNWLRVKCTFVTVVQKHFFLTSLRGFVNLYFSDGCLKPTDSLRVCIMANQVIRQTALYNLHVHVALNNDQ